MAQVKLETLGVNPAILIDLPDFVREGTVMKRKAQVQKMIYEPATRVTTLELLIIPFERLESGDYGAPLLDSPYFRYEERVMIADNATIVAMNGTKLVLYAPEDVTELEAEGGVLHGIDWMRQGDWFRMVAATQQINVDAMIIAEVQNRYANGY